VECPTRTPGTSVMAFSGPVSIVPMAKPRLRNRVRAVEACATAGTLTGA
jgi:hypothetical protein